MSEISFLLQRKWRFLSPNKQLIEELAKKASIPPLVARILLNRGICEKDEVLSHLSPFLSSLSDPFLMADMEKAVIRLSHAIKNKERVVIFGDYDVDGVTSSAILIRFLKELGLEVTSYIPHRLEEGYGLNPNAIKKLSQTGVDLIITVDCGISSVEEVRLANSLGIDVIITDHHQVPKELPPAIAILNPKRWDCRFPFKELAGVGVVFNLIRALRRWLYERGFWKDGKFPNLKQYLDIVALGTIADIVPLLGDNRILVRTGLKVLEQTNKVGIKALCEVAGVRPPFNTETIGYILAPRINAAGRMDHAQKALRLLLTQDEAEAKMLAKQLNELNQKRQAEEARILKEAQEIAKEMGEKNAYVIASKGWHRGVIGIVASRLMDIFYRPIVMVSLDDEIAHGSARSPKGLNLYKLLLECGECLKAFGGHSCAAGLCMSPDMLDKFSKEFEQVSTRAIDALEEKEPFICLDAKVNINELSSPEFKNMFSLLEPFGPGYEEPFLCVSGSLISKKKIVGEKHLKLYLCEDRSKEVELLAWGLADKFDIDWNNTEIACRACLNTWNGITKLELRLLDLRFLS